MMTPCIGEDPQCPCQDGDPCHYLDTATTKAMPLPRRVVEKKAKINGKKIP